MCGIVGYVGPRAAVSPLVEGLSRLEYRGYDSAGVAVLNGKGVETRKLAGRIAGLRDLLERMPVHGSCGIGHTRWATHGAPTERNAHPHTDCTGTIALVHNGIIENADVLRKRLEQDGHVFVTDTTRKRSSTSSKSRPVRRSRNGLSPRCTTSRGPTVSLCWPRPIPKKSSWRGVARRSCSASAMGNSSWPRTRAPCWGIRGPWST